MRASLLFFILVAASVGEAQSTQTRKTSRPKTEKPKAELEKLAPTGAIEGDVYLLTKGGDVKKGAATKVGLVLPTAALEAAFRKECDDTGQSYDAMTRQDSLAVASTANPYERMALLQASLDHIINSVNDGNERKLTLLIASGRSSSTGINAHYSFADVPAGNYFLVASMTLNDRPTNWLVPIAVKAGDNVKLDLDNENTAIPGVFICDRPYPLHF